MVYYKLNRIDKVRVFENSWDFNIHETNFDFLTYVYTNPINFNMVTFNNIKLISKILNKKYYWDR